MFNENSIIGSEIILGGQTHGHADSISLTCLIKKRNLAI